MFAIGLGELIIVGIVGLVILGGVGAVFFLTMRSQKPKG
ncbi:MAG: Sec-independent protein translocase subunit TatA/TatB [Polyangiaceae bacterium]